MFRLAKERGYKTYFYSAQPENQMMIMSIMGKTWVDYLLFPSDIGYKRSEGMHDHALLPLFEQIDLSEGNHFIVLHQRGSHAPYAYYLSEEEKAFKENTPLDNYDSTLYNTDQFIEKVFKQLKQHHDDWVLIYTSDHGQFVSNQVYNQGTAKEANYLVPIMTYTENTALQQLQRPFLACDRLFHQQLSTFIIKMLGYDMPISDCQHGVINSLILTGDSGYLEVQGNQPPAFFIPKNRSK